MCPADHSYRLGADRGVVHLSSRSASPMLTLVGSVPNSEPQFSYLPNGNSMVS